MQPETKIKVTRTGIVFSVLGLIAGYVSLASPGYFICAGIASLAPVFFGMHLVRVAGVILCIINFVVGVREIQANTSYVRALLKATQEHARTNSPAPARVTQ